MVWAADEESAVDEITNGAAESLDVAQWIEGFFTEWISFSPITFVMFALGGTWEKMCSDVPGVPGECFHFAEMHWIPLKKQNI